MVELSNSALILKWLAGKIADKAFSGIWNHLRDRIRHSNLAGTINAKFQSDPDAERICDGVPVIRQDVLADEHLRSLFEQCVDDDFASLGKYMIDEQLIQLSLATRNDTQIHHVHETIGRIVHDSLQIIFTTDKTLLSQFIFFARQGDAQEHGDILNAIYELQIEINELKEELISNERRTNISGEEVASFAAVKNINYLLEENIRLSRRERQFLDEKLEKQWDEIQNELAINNYALAIEKGKLLEEWLKSDAVGATSNLRSKAHVILAHLAVIATDQNEKETEDDFSDAYYHLREAKAEMVDLDQQHKARITALDAKLNYLSGRRDIAVTMLEGASQPSCISTMLAILLDQNKFNEAANLAVSKRFHEKWIDSAVTAFIRSERDEEALKALNWSKNNTSKNVIHKCYVAFAQSVLIHHKVGLPGGIQTNFDITSKVRTAIESALAILQPVIAGPLADGSPSNGLEVDAVGYACVALHVLGRKQECRQHAEVLAQYRPIPVNYGHAVLYGDIASTDTLPDQLREDHPSSFEAHFLSLLIESISLGLPNEFVFENAYQTLFLALNDKDRDRIIGFMSDLVSHEDNDRFKKVVELCEKHLPKEHRRRKYLNIESLLRNGDGITARKCLDDIEDRTSPEWLKYSADTYRTLGDLYKSADELVAVSKVIPRDIVCYQAAMAAYEVDRIDTMVECLETAVVLNDSNVAAFHNLAIGYIRLGNHLKASECLERLEELLPDKLDYVLQRASELAIAGNLSEAIKVCTNLCDREPNYLEAVLQRAVFMRLNNQKKQAFEFLEKVSERFGDDVDFLALYMGLGYEVGKDIKAARAMERILELQRDGTAKRQVLNSVTKEELRELTKVTQDAHKKTNELLLQGKCPWTLMSVILNRSVFSNWSFRTQPDITPSTPLNQAEYSIYSTNAFTVQPNSGNKGFVEDIKASQANQPVVIDFSALTTLYELGLLSEVSSFFGKILYPDEYREKFLNDQALLESGYGSREEAFHKIIKLCQQPNPSVSIVPSNLNSDISLITQLSETSHSGKKYTVIDASYWLLKSGKIENTIFKQIPGNENASDRSEEFAKSVELGPILIDESAIHLLHTSECLDTLVQSVPTQITDKVYERITLELQSISSERKTADRNLRLISDLTREDKFIAKALINRNSGNSEQVTEDLFNESGVEQKWIWASMLLALQENTPLLADDRFSQMYINNRSSIGAFGTDQVLIRMYEEAVLSVDILADAFFKLIQWRYRFLVPHIDVLLTFACRFDGIGRPLVIISQYMHDCMRDFGLLGGKEPTQPPTSVAIQFYSRWVTGWAEFVAKVWECESLSNEKKKSLTKWVVLECIPNPPRNIPLSGRHQIASNTDVTFLFSLLRQTCLIREENNAKEMVDIVVTTLGISESRFDRIVSQFLNSQSLLFSKKKEIHEAFQRRVFQVSHIREGRIVGIRPAVLAEHLGMLEVGQAIPEPDNDLLAAINDVAKSHRIMEKGPYVFWGHQVIAGKSKGTAGDVTPLVFSPSSQIRKSVLSFLDHSNNCPLSPLTLKTIDQNRTNATSDDFMQWFPAACEIYECLDTDFKLKIGALRQCLQASFMDDVDQYWNNIVRPDTRHLSSIHGEGLPINECLNILNLLINEDSIEHTLDAYDAQFGHLPLIEDLSLGSLLRRWCDTTKETQVWADVWKWANQHRITFRRYHACRAFAENPELIPNDKKTEFWSQFGQILDVAREHEEENVLTKLWLIHGFLTQHFLRQCELNTPLLTNDQLLCQSFWAASEVTNVIADYCETEEMIAELLKDIKQLAVTSELMWEVARPCRESSRTRHVVLHHPAPWTYALALSLKKVESLGTVELSGTHQLQLAVVLSVGCLRFDSVENPHKPRIWIYDEPVKEISRRVLKQLTDNQARNTLQSVIDALKNTKTKQDVTESLNEILELDTNNQQILTSLLHNITYSESLPSQRVIQLLQSPKWYRRVLSQMETKAFREFSDFLGEHQARKRGILDTIIPYAYIDTALEEEMTEVRRRELVAFGIMAAAAGENPILLRRILKGNYSQFIKNEYSYWHSQLQKVLQSAPPFVVARLRDLLSSLHL